MGGELTVRGVLVMAGIVDDELLGDGCASELPWLLCTRAPLVAVHQGQSLCTSDPSNNCIRY